MTHGSRLYPAILLVALVAAAVLYRWADKPAPAEPAGPPLVSLEQMGHLVAVKLNYANVIDFAQARKVGIPGTQWDLALGGTKVLLIAKGDCTVASDLRQARYENVQKDAKRLTVVLAAPAPLQARINFAGKERGGSYFYAVTSHGLQYVAASSNNRNAALDNVVRRAQGEVEQACRQPAVVATAKQNTEAVIRNMLSATGWTADFIWK